MNRLMSIIIFFSATTFIVSACASDEIKVFRIDGHKFYIPENYLESGSIPWLPTSQHDGFTFYIDPESAPPEKISVLIESTSVTCASDQSPDDSPLASACLAAKNRALTTEGSEIEKSYPYGHSKQWDYIAEGRSDSLKKVVVASCSAMNDGNGLCRSFGNFGELVYTVSLRDNQIDQLPSTRQKIYRLLLSWEH